MRDVWLPLLLAIGLLTACGTPVKNPVSGRAERTVLDEAAEIALGVKEHALVLQETAALDNPKLQAYVNALGQRLARQSHRGQLDWHFTVLDSPQINAFALPGGYVYVTRGILAYMESEADLAGVLGHEIGHVTARHGAQRATRQQDASLGVLAASVLGAVLERQGVGGAGRVASDVSQAAAAGYVASYGREQELQADTLGAEYLARAQFNPSNMVDVIRVLKNQELFAADQARALGRPTVPRNSWLASHPSNDQRLEAIGRLAAQYKGQYGDDGRARYLQAIDGMPFGESASQGLTRGRNFYHEPFGLALTAPAQWSIQNTPERLLLVNAASDAALVVRLAPAALGASHDDVLRNVLKPTSGRSERITLNGLSATRFSGLRATAQGQTEPVVASVVSGPGANRFLLLWSGRDAAALQRARAGLLEAEASFRALSVADRADARPWLLRVVPLPGAGLGELARRSPLDLAEQQLRLINAVYGGGALTPGQQVKVVERQ